MGIGCEFFYTSLKVIHFRVSELITTGAKWGGYGSSGIPWHFWARCVKVRIQTAGDSFFLFMMYVLCLNQTEENIWLLYTLPIYSTQQGSLTLDEPKCLIFLINCIKQVTWYIQGAPYGHGRFLRVFKNYSFAIEAQDLARSLKKANTNADFLKRMSHPSKTKLQQLFKIHHIHMEHTVCSLLRPYSEGRTYQVSDS